MKRYLQSFMTGEALGQFVKVGIVGLFNTALSFGLFNLFLVVIGWEWFWAVAGAFAIATFVSYLLNRRWTFQLDDGRVSARETASFYLINIVAWAATEATLWIADVFWGPLNAVQANVAYLAASVLILVPKFASYRDVVFGKAIRARHHAGEPSTDSRADDEGAPVA